LKSLQHACDAAAIGGELLVSAAKFSTERICCVVQTGILALLRVQIVKLSTAAKHPFDAGRS
jgi:hypothetical protein